MVLALENFAPYVEGQGFESWKKLEEHQLLDSGSDIKAVEYGGKKNCVQPTS